MVSIFKTCVVQIKCSLEGTSHEADPSHCIAFLLATIDNKASASDEISLCLLNFIALVNTTTLSVISRNVPPKSAEDVEHLNYDFQKTIVRLEAAVDARDVTALRKIAPPVNRCRGWKKP